MHLIQSSHTPGRHCASTGLQDLVNHHGLDWSEAVCFGLGSGLGIWYLTLPGLDPSPMIHVRSLDIEAEFFARIGHPFQWQRDADPQATEAALIEALESGKPALLQTDIFHLPYYSSETHYPGHVIVAWGVDPVKKVFFVTDTERTDLMEVPFEAMRKARYCPEHILAIEGNFFAPSSITPPENLAGTMAAAMVTGSRRILHGSPGMGGMKGVNEGIAALELWQAQLPAWDQMENWQWAARFTYQVIEKRGTGGGGFRYLYADFLKEAEEVVPRLAGRGLSERMLEIGRAWSELALALKAVSEETTPDFHPVMDALDEVTRREKAYHQEILEIDFEGF